MKKKLSSLALCMAFLLSLLPSSLLRAKLHIVSVAGTLLASGKYYTVKADGTLDTAQTSKPTSGGYVYAADKGSDEWNLTLHNAKIDSFSSAGIFAYGVELTILLEGTNTVIGECGIRTIGGNLTIKEATVGNGASLWVDNTHESNTGISVDGNLTLESGHVKASGVPYNNKAYGVQVGGNINVTGGKLEGHGGKEANSFGVYSKGKITVSGGELTGTADTGSDNSYGIVTSAGDIEVSNGATVKGTSGNAKDTFGVAAGIDSPADIIVKSGGKLTGKSGNSTAAYYNSNGVYASDKISVDGENSEVNGNAGTAYSFSQGVTAFGGITLTNKAVLNGTSAGIDSASTDDDSKAYGVYAEGDTSVSTDSTLTGKAGPSKNVSYGVCVNNAKIVAKNGGSINGTSEGGGSTKYSDGVVAVYGAIEIDNATVTGTAGKATDGSFGVWTNKQITVENDGKLIAKSGESGDMSHGVSVEWSTDDSFSHGIKVYGGEVSAKAGKSENVSYGIYSKGKVIVDNDGFISAEGGKATGTSNGITLFNTTIDVVKGIVLADGGEGAESFGVWSNSETPMTFTKGTIFATSKTDTAIKGVLPTTTFYYRTSDAGAFSKGPNASFDASKVGYVELTSAYATIKYEANGGTGTMAAEYVPYGGLTVPENGFTKAGHRFTGWKIDTLSRLIQPGEKIIFEDAITITLTAQWEKYAITEGADSTWQQGSGKDLTIKSNADFENFKEVQVDGKTLDPSNYTAKAGSTIITIKSAYLETLSPGEHTVSILYKDGSKTDTKVTVSEKKEDNKPGDNPGDEPGDKPGDDSGDDPGDKPGDDPGDDPGDKPGDDPGDDPGDKPGDDLGDDPGDKPGVNPGDNPSNPPPTVPQTRDITTLPTLSTITTFFVGVVLLCLTVIRRRKLYTR